ncbi:MAG TPA: GGDEF domain-containing protein [Ureibacillus sp.]|nr:GGDEF domain-containing protein [Ureibacillus sp.]
MIGTPIFDDESNFQQVRIKASDHSTQNGKQKMFENYAYHDPLTGLPNRRYFDKKLTESIEKLNIKGNGFSILVFDIDDFHKINDRWSYEVGDQVLRIVGCRTQRAVGENGVAARIGGDEFIVLLSNNQNEEELKIIIVELMKALSKEIITDKDTSTITISIGATICTKKFMSETYYIRSADVALKKVKQSGKNQYHISHS